MVIRNIVIMFKGENQIYFYFKHLTSKHLSKFIYKLISNIVVIVHFLFFAKWNKYMLLIND